MAPKQVTLFDAPAMDLYVRAPETGDTPGTVYAQNSLGYSVQWYTVGVNKDEVKTEWKYLDESNVEQTLAPTDVFKPNTVYTVYITLKPIYSSTTYYFGDPPKITFDGEEVTYASKSANQVVIKKEFPATEARRDIEKLQFAVDEPLFGETPDETVELTAGPAKVISVLWKDDKDHPLTASDTFQADTTYTLTVRLEANLAYQFSDVLDKENCIMNVEYLDHGQRPDDLRIISQDQAELDFQWTVPGPVHDMKLNTAQQAYGETPNIYSWPAEGEEGYYVQETRWIDQTDSKTLTYEDVLTEGHVYQMEIDVYPGKGYKLDASVTATLNGVPVLSANIDSDHVTLLFDAPVSEAKLIHAVAATYAYPVEPGEEAMESVDLPEDVNYEAPTVVWYDEDGNDIYNFQFEDGKTYTVDVTVIPDLGYAFAEDCTYTLNGEAATFTPDGRNVILSKTYEVSSQATVSFDSNGGDGFMASAKVEKGGKYTLPECTFTAPEGKAFDKWDKGAPGEEIEVTASMTLKALWKDASRVMPFTDVVEGKNWFYSDVKIAYESYLIDGYTSTTYEPYKNMTYAQAVTLAARMHQKYTTGSVTLKNSPTKPWYQTYVDYAKENHIISKDYDWNADATRAGYIEIFACALPEEAFTAKNTVADDAIPDVRMTHPQATEIYKLYRAGILEGSSERIGDIKVEHLCKPDDKITRAEVAAILTRMMNPAERKEFTLS